MISYTVQVVAKFIRLLTVNYLHGRCSESMNIEISEFVKILIHCTYVLLSRALCGSVSDFGLDSEFIVNHRNFSIRAKNLFLVLMKYTIHKTYQIKVTALDI